MEGPNLLSPWRHDLLEKFSKYKRGGKLKVQSCKSNGLTLLNAIYTSIGRGSFFEDFNVWSYFIPTYICIFRFTH